MAWRIEYSKEAEREIAKLDRLIAQRIIRFMGGRVAKLEAIS
jgi:mRNA-degrading endonuclease RelE of RelBE toxin-antitoxin system